MTALRVLLAALMAPLAVLLVVADMLGLLRWPPGAS